MRSIAAMVLVALAVIVIGFIALYVWARRVERDVEFPAVSQLAEEDANILRLGIALSANAPRAN
jgi:uncharacterized iron-regulated membrane protein